jgi:hypothetical protein
MPPLFAGRIVGAISARVTEIFQGLERICSILPILGNATRRDMPLPLFIFARQNGMMVCSDEHD